MKNKQSTINSLRGARAALAAALMLAYGSAAQADVFDWIQVNGSHNWEDAGNWNKISGGGGHGYPQFAGDVAYLTNGNTSANSYGTLMTLQISGPVTVGEFRCRSNMKIDKASGASPDARLILDNLGNVARFANDNDWGGGGRTINVPLEVVGEAIVGNANDWSCSLYLNNGLIGDAGSVIRFWKETRSEGNVQLSGNPDFHGTIYYTGGQAPYRGLVLTKDSELGNLRKIVNSAMLDIRYPISGAALAGRLEHTDGAMLRLSSKGSLTNGVDNPSQYIPNKGTLQFDAPGVDMWPDSEPVKLGNSTLYLGADEAMVGGLVSTGGAIISTSASAPGFTVVETAVIATEGCGTMTLKTHRDIQAGAAGDTLDDAAPGAFALGNGVVAANPRIAFDFMPAKITNTAAPFAITRMTEQDFTPLPDAGAADFAIHANAAAAFYAPADMSFKALRLQGSNDIRPLAGQQPEPAFYLIEGLLSLTAGGHKYLHIPMVFGSSKEDPTDAVIQSLLPGGTSFYFEWAPMWAKNFYLFGGGGAMLFKEIKFNLSGDIYVNFTSGASLTLISCTGADKALVTINSVGDGAFQISGTTIIGGLRGNGVFRNAIYLGKSTAIISNAVDSAFIGRITESSSSETFKIRKIGPATQTFTGANTATWGIEIHEGTLRLDGVTSQEEYVFIGADESGLFPGGTLAGTGSVGLSTTLAAGGTIAPAGANETGTLTFTGALAATGGVIAFELASATEFDKIVVDGDADLGAASITVDTLADYAPFSKTVFPIITATGSLNTEGIPRIKGYTLWQEGDTLYLAANPAQTFLIVR